MRYLRQNTAQRVTVGPALDKTDGITPEVALTATNEHLTLMVDDGGVPTLVLDANATASGGNNDLVHVTNDDAGFYDLELTAAQTNYLGRAMLSINYATDHCPIFHEFTILPQQVYDSLVLGSDALQVDAIQVTGTAQTARDLGGALPAAAPGANGGLPTTNGAKLNQTADLSANQDVRNVAGTLPPVTLANGAHGGAAATLQLGGAGGLTATHTGNTTGSVGSVTGAVGSVTADVGITQAGADKVWGTAARTLTGFGTLVADIWASATRTLTACVDSSGVTTLLTRIVGTLLTGNHSPQSGDGYARIGAAGAGLTAIGDARMANLDVATSTRLATAGYAAPLDAAGTRAAVGLASASLDTQLGTIPKVIASGTAQAATASTLQLAASAAFANDELNGCLVVITGGTTGVGQVRRIYDYVGSTDTASIEPNWATTPTGTITYAIVSGAAAWDEVRANHATVNTFGEVSTPADVATSVWAASVRSLTDKAGFALSAAGVQAVWDALSSALSTVGSIGKRLVDYLTGDIFTRLGAPAGATIAADLAAIKALADNIDPARPTLAVVTDAGNSTSSFKSNRTEAANDFWKGALVVITSGTMIGQVKEIGAYNGTSKVMTLTSGQAFTATPADGTTMAILNR